MSEKYTLNNLLKLMRKLREPTTGCPWDIKQSYETIAPCTIEEAYEVVDAIDRKDFSHLKEELGDLLFQVVFYAQLGDEDGYFDFNDIIDALTSKLIRRHPHVFPDGHLDSQASQQALSDKQIKTNWETMKQTERNNKGKHNILADIPVGLPALTRGEKLQKRAAKNGFDWENIQDVMAKMHEELNELDVEIQKDVSSKAVVEELGDMFFTCINLARHLGVSSESIVRKANAKFETRFNFLEANAECSVSELTPEQMHLLWEKSKQQ